jgi:hypothetical protein
MVSKCANPGCSAVFLYFRLGKLFRVEVQPTELNQSGFGSEVGTKKPVRRVEYFWLCDICAAKMTLISDKTSGVKIKMTERAQAAAL